MQECAPCLGTHFLYHDFVLSGLRLPNLLQSKYPDFLQGQGRRRGLGSDFFLEWCRVETSNLELWEGGISLASFQQAFALVLNP